MAERLAPPDVANAMLARAERFMKDVAELSPMPAGTVPDHAQAWPRAANRTVMVTGETSLRTSTRILSPKVVWDKYANEHQGPGWRVTLYGSIEVVIDPATLSVRKFMDDVLCDTLLHDPITGRSPISQEEAISRATAYLVAGGVDTKTLILESATLSADPEPQNGMSSKWDVSLKRLWRGVPFHQQGIFVSMDASWGRLIGSGGLGLGLPPPTSATVGIQPSRGIEIARALMSLRSRTLTGEPTIELKIVMPTNYWTDGTQHPVPGASTRLAWLVRGQDGEEAKKGFADVWVDAATGDVLGGELWGFKGQLNIEKETSILSALGMSNQLELQSLSDSRSPLVVLEPGKAPLHFYGALSGCTPRAHNRRSTAFTPTHKLVVGSASGKSTSFEYDANSGLIRSVEGGLVQVSRALQRALLGPQR
jgi:hypothetical protein